MSAWHSLFARTDDGAALAEQVRLALKTLGYTLYNPFGIMPVRPYPQTIRLFAAPAGSGWVRLVGQPADALLPLLSAYAPVVWLSLAGAQCSIHAWINEAAIPPAQFPGADVAAVTRALHDAPLAEAEAHASGLPLDVLPPDVQALAKGVDTRQAAAMFERLSGDLMKRAGGDAQAARGLIDPKDAPQWQSAGGARLRGLAAALGLPAGWAHPDFTTLRDAYQAAERQRRKPDAPPFPGDSAALAAVPDALSYVPLFGGKDAGSS